MSKSHKYSKDPEDLRQSILGTSGESSPGLRATVRLVPPGGHLGVPLKIAGLSSLIVWQRVERSDITLLPGTCGGRSLDLRVTSPGEPSQNG